MNFVEFIFEDQRAKRNKFPLKITRYTVFEITLISCDFKDFVKHLKLAISKKLVQIILLQNMQANFCLSE